MTGQQTQTQHKIKGSRQSRAGLCMNVGFHSFLIADMSVPGLFDALFNRIKEVSAYQPVCHVCFCR